MADREDRSLESRTAALGVAAPANVDLTRLGQRDNPQEDWGEPMEAEAQHGGNHTTRPDRTEAQRGQGVKTRAAFKDIVSRRT